MNNNSCIFITLRQLCAWLSENKGRFKPGPLGGDCSGDPTEKETVQSYVQQEINTYFRVPASTGKSQINLFEVVILAKVVIVG